MVDNSPASFTFTNLFDSHCHLNHPRLFPDVPELISRASSAGVQRMLVVGYDLASSQRALALAEKYPQLCAAVGFHPHDAADLSPEYLAQLRTLAQSPRVVAIGETGLDFFRDLSPRDIQRAAFDHHLQLAAETRLPLIVHCRDAQRDVLQVLETHPDITFVWHCFDGTPAQAERALAAGACLGFAARFTHPKADVLRSLLPLIPRDRLLLETDSPYLLPHSLRRTARDNEPSYLPLIASSMSEILNISPTALATVITANAQRIFHRTRDC